MKKKAINQYSIIFQKNRVESDNIYKEKPDFKQCSSPKDGSEMVPFTKDNSTDWGYEFIDEQFYD